MQGMPQSMAAPSGWQAASLATGLLLGVGVALYQLTSLVLGPASSQQISLSLRTVGHEPALLLPPGPGPSLNGVLTVSYLRATVEPATDRLPHPRPSSGSGSSSGRRPALPAPLSVPTVTPVEPAIMPRVDSEKHGHPGGDGDGGGLREHD